MLENMSSFFFLKKKTVFVCSNEKGKWYHLTLVYLNKLWVYLYVSVFVSPVWGALGDQKTALDSWNWCYR